MRILGNIIKSAIEITDNVLPEKSPSDNQKEVLKMLLSKASNTAFGLHYQFEAILNSEDISKTFSERIPFFDYNALHRDWWSRQLNDEKNVTWPGDSDYYALSSGTTGNSSKRIPITDDMLDCIRKAGIKQVLALANFDLEPDFFEKEIMMLGSSTSLEENRGHLEGEISGISASRLPFWFKGFYKPGDAISSISDWDDKVEEIAKNARNWDIGAICGIPSWNELMIKRVIAYHGVDTIHDIWPNLKIFASGGVAFQPYKKSFEALVAKPLTIIDTYFASEGFIACQTRPNENMSMTLLTDNGIYFEFVPFSEKYIDENGAIKPDAPSLTIDQVEPAIDYALIISTVSGTWRYLIGDTIQFTDVDKAEIVISGRTKHFLNVVGSQLSVLKMNTAIQKIEEHYQLTIPEFTVSAIRTNSGYIHHWFLGCDCEFSEVNLDNLSQQLDEYLKGSNKNYAVARSKALTGVKVNLVPLDVFFKWNEHEKKKGGQVKTPRVLKEEQFESFEKFALQNC